MKIMNKIFMEKHKLLKELKIYIIDKKKQLIFLFITELVLLAYFIINPLFYKFYIDRVLINKELKCLKFVIIGQLLFYMIYTLLLYLNKNLRFRFVNFIIYKMRIKVFNNFLKFETDQMIHYNPGDMKQIMVDDFELVEKFILKQMIDYIISFVFLIVCGIAVECQVKLTHFFI